MNDLTPKWIQDVGGHECPKHGRYYGVCHCCLIDEAAVRELRDAERTRKNIADLESSLSIAVEALREIRDSENSDKNHSGCSLHTNDGDDGCDCGYWSMEYPMLKIRAMKALAKIEGGKEGG